MQTTFLAGLSYHIDGAAFQSEGDKRNVELFPPYLEVLRERVVSSPSEVSGLRAEMENVQSKVEGVESQVESVRVSMESKVESVESKVDAMAGDVAKIMQLLQPK